MIEQVFATPFTVALSRLPNKRRKRNGIVEELLQLDDHSFQCMMRMPKWMFQELSRNITPHLRKNWTAHSRRMAKLGSGSDVEPAAILAATIRWLAGGSVWDVAFMFKISDKTFHAYVPFPMLLMIEPFVTLYSGTNGE